MVTIVSKANFGKIRKIRQSYDFTRVYRKGRRYHHPSLTLVICSNQSRAQANTTISYCETSRLGLSVSRKVGNSVVRNRLKRRLREIFRLHHGQLLSGRDIVVVPKAFASRLAYADLTEIFFMLCRKAGLLRKTQVSGKKK